MVKSSKIHFYVGIVIFLVIFPCPKQTVFAFQNEPDGFRGIQWETDIKDLSDMVLDEDGGDSKLYRRNGDTLNIGAAAIESCSYIFYQGRFYGVFIEFTSLQNANAIKETLLQQHGEGLGLRPGRFVETYQWLGSLVNIWCDFSDASRKGTIIYFYKPLDQEKEANEKKKAQKDAPDL
jgi:hypothetical protein